RRHPSLSPPLLPPPPLLVPTFPPLLDPNPVRGEYTRPLRRLRGGGGRLGRRPTPHRHQPPTHLATAGAKHRKPCAHQEGGGGASFVGPGHPRPWSSSGGSWWHGTKIWRGRNAGCGAQIRCLATSPPASSLLSCSVIGTSPSTTSLSSYTWIAYPTSCTNWSSTSPWWFQHFSKLGDSPASFCHGDHDTAD
ncbi:unnamed protein product, partial [Urochloa humidicola]